MKLLPVLFFIRKKKQRVGIEEGWPFTVKLIDEPGYPVNICLKRFYSHYKWGINVKKYLSKRNKPDVIYCAVPSLTVGCVVANFCKKNSLRFVIDIQDLWPEAFQMVFDVPVISSMIFTPFKILANYIYKSADIVCAVSKTYADRAMVVNKKCKYTIVAYLGTDLAVFDIFAKQNRIDCIEGLPQKEGLWLGYCGSLSNSYDLVTVIDALYILNESGYQSPKFIIMGDGDKQLAFMEKAKDMGCDVSFLGRLPYSVMCCVLCQCDIVINPIVGQSVASIINKHGDYAASGHPVINLQSSQEYIDLINKYQMGINVEPGNSVELADKLKYLCEDEDLRREMGKNARKCAEEVFDRKITYKEIARVIERDFDN